VVALFALVTLYTRYGSDPVDSMEPRRAIVQLVFLEWVLLTILIGGGSAIYLRWRRGTWPRRKARDD
jgi:hypothetical protein